VSGRALTPPLPGGDARSPASPRPAGAIARLRDRVRALRNGLVARPRFRARALGVWPAARLARREAAALFDLCAGFVYSQVLAATVELDLYDWLAAGPRTIDEVAARGDLPTASAERLLRAAVALDLLSQTADGRFALGRLGAALVANPGVVAMIRHHRHLYADLADPVALLRAGREDETALSRFWRYAGRHDVSDDRDVAEYSALMSASQGALVAEILEAYPFDGHVRVLDIGGGEGTFAMALARRYPHLAVRLFDLPPVADRARSAIARADLEGRIETVGGHFDHDMLPTGADLVTLVRIVHDHDDDVVARLFERIHAALQPGGTLLVAEPLAKTRGFERMGDAYFGMYLFAMGSGRPRPAREIVAMLARAGFGEVAIRRTRMPLEGTLISARKARAADDTAT